MTELDAPIRHEADLVEALRDGGFRPVSLQETAAAGSA